MEKLSKIIENIWNDRDSIVDNSEVTESIEEVLKKLNDGEIRVSIKDEQKNTWIVNEWIKKAILLYFRTSKMKKYNIGDFHFHDKIPLKNDFDKIRCVPPAVVRYGVFIEDGAIIMPSYINIGAYIGSSTMIDINSCIGSCAQIGKRCHISGGVIIGGVIEPMNASPVIIEDDVFIGANSNIVEGVRVCEGAVLGAGVTITSSTRIIDVRGEESKEIKGIIPPYSVVINGSRKKTFKCGEYYTQCALIIGERKASTNAKVALNQHIR